MFSMFSKPASNVDFGPRGRPVSRFGSAMVSNKPAAVIVSNSKGKPVQILMNSAMGQQWADEKK